MLTQPNPMSNSPVPHQSVGNNLCSGPRSSLPFHDRVPTTGCLDPSVKPSIPTVERATHTSSSKEICKCLILENVPKVKSASQPISAGTPLARAITLARGALSGLSSSELIYHYDTLNSSGKKYLTLTQHSLCSFTQHSRLEWVLVIKAHLAEMMPETYCLLCKSLNLYIIDAELAKECAAGSVLGLFQY